MRGNAESEGKRLSGKTRPGNPALRQVLIQIAHAASRAKDTHAASRAKDTYLAAQYRRIAARRGKKRALVAVGHTILVIVSHILTRRQPYRELGVGYFDELDRQRVEHRLVHRLERLGYTVTRQPPTPEPVLAAVAAP